MINLTWTMKKEIGLCLGQIFKTIANEDNFIHADLTGSSLNRICKKKNQLSASGKNEGRDKGSQGSQESQGSMAGFLENLLCQCQRREGKGLFLLSECHR